jgi:hypothetical protein
VGDENEMPAPNLEEVEVGEINTGTVAFRLRDDGILQGIALPARTQNLEDARVNLEACRRLTGEARVPLLLDIRDTGTLTREARELYAGETGAREICALAFVGDSAFTRVVGNLFIRLAKTRYPVRLFTDERQASKWLRRYAR